MMPQRAPTNSFSARWQARASCLRSMVWPLTFNRAAPVETSMAADELSPEPKGTFAADDQIRSAKFVAGIFERDGRADDVVAPVAAGRRDGSSRSQTSFSANCAEYTCSSRSRALGDSHRTIEIDGRRHHEAQIVVSVLADEVDASGGSEDAAWTAEHLRKSLPRVVGAAEGESAGKASCSSAGSVSAAIVNENSAMPVRSGLAHPPAKIKNPQ